MNQEQINDFVIKANESLIETLKECPLDKDCNKTATIMIGVMMLYLKAYRKLGLPDYDVVKNALQNIVDMFTIMDVETGDVPEDASEEGREFIMEV